MIELLIGSIDTIELRHPGRDGDQQLVRGTSCYLCHKPIRRDRRYWVRTVRRAGMAAPAFYYCHFRCKEQPR